MPRKGVNEDLALRVYTTRLLGSDPKLVLHGGGNTSVKTTVHDLLGEDVEVLCVKGSRLGHGHDRAAGPAGGAAGAAAQAARAATSCPTRTWSTSSASICSIPPSPNPSVETLLHAFLPHKFIDHTHSTAVLALTDQPDGEALARDVYGERVAYVPYTMPGFALAKTVADVFDKQSRTSKG